MRSSRTLILCYGASFYLYIDDSLRFVVPIRIPDRSPKLALEDPLVLPCFLSLLRDTFYQRRRAVFPFVFGAVGRMGRSGGCLTTPSRQTRPSTGTEWSSDYCEDDDAAGWVSAKGRRSTDRIVLPVFRPGRLFRDRQCRFDFVR